MKQADWKRSTSWSDAPPTPADIWRSLMDCAEPVRAAALACARANPLLKAGLAQHIAAEQGMEVVPAEMYRLTATRPQPKTVDALLAARATLVEWKVRFTNLPSGRFTELLFMAAFSDWLKKVGLVMREETEQRNFVDFRLETDAFSLAINLKNAGIQLASAQDLVGLDPKDTLPLATYKLFGATRAVGSPLIYVFLVDWSLSETLRAAYLNSILNEHERRVFKMIASIGGIPRDVEDAFIAATVTSRFVDLITAVGYPNLDVGQLPFRCISAARCKAIFYRQEDRTPYVFQQRMKTDPAVHISIAKETVSFAEFAQTWLASSQSRVRLLDALSNVSQMVVPDPPV